MMITGNDLVALRRQILSFGQYELLKPAHVIHKKSNSFQSEDHQSCDIKMNKEKSFQLKLAIITRAWGTAN